MLAELFSCIDAEKFEQCLTPSARLPLLLAKIWIDASTAMESGFLDVAEVPSFTGGRDVMTRAHSRIQRLEEEVEKVRALSAN